MVVRVVDGAWGLSLRLGAAILAGLCAACASVSDPAGLTAVTQDRYDFATCNEITGAYANQTTRVKDLTELTEKAEASPGGVIVSYAAYRSELATARALLAAAKRAAQKNNCDLTAKVAPAPAPAQMPRQYDPLLLPDRKR